MFRNALLIGAVSLLLALPAAAPAQQVTSRSQINYQRDRFGRLQSVKVTITLPMVNHFYVFNLSKSFLERPIAAQVNALDQQFNLGDDAAAVRAVLQSIQQARQDEDNRRQQEQIRRMSQPPITIPQPPLPQPPITIPQAPGQPSIQIPRPSIPQPPITIPR